MSWLFQNNKIAKSHFYVWYLGSKEADGVRGSAVVLPAMRHLLKESFKKTPSKATVQISHKGLKLVQSVPAMSRSGKVKMQLVKFQISANCITYSVTGKPPFDDVVGVVMLVLNPEMQSPMHVHCYRCDCPETAQIMHANIQLLLARPEHQRAIMDLEHRLFLSGLLIPRSASSASRPIIASRSNSGVSERKRVPDTQRILVNELKSKMASTGDLSKTGYHFDSLNEKRKSHLSMNELNSIDDTVHRFRLFGDTLMRPEKKARSMDNINDTNMVSTDLRGGSGLQYPPSRRFPRSEVTDPFGHSYERNLGHLDGQWTNSRPRRNNSFKCHL